VRDALARHSMLSKLRAFRALGERQSPSLGGHERVTEEGHPPWRMPGIGQLLLRCLNSRIHSLALPSPCAGEKESTSYRFPLWGLSSPTDRRTGSPGKQSALGVQQRCGCRSRIVVGLNFLRPPQSRIPLHAKQAD
jgi:hypothetical protein